MRLFQYFALFGIAVGSCPDLCQCEERNDQFYVDCSHNQLSSIDELEIPFEVNILNLSYNSLIKVPFFEKFPNLVELDLSGNYFEQILDSEFKTLPSIELIKLDNNEKLVFISEYAFFSLPRLEKISFSKCSKLKWISYRAFYDSYQLTELDLSHTSISVIEEDILIYAPKISKINLEGTSIMCNCINKWMRREETKKEISPVDDCEESATNTADNCGPVIIHLYDEDKISGHVDSPLVLICAGMGYPTHTSLIYNSDGEQIGRKGVLKIRSLQYFHEGEYTCKTENRFGTAEYKFQLEVFESLESPESEFERNTLDINADFLEMDGPEKVELIGEYEGQENNLASETVDIGPTFEVDFDFVEDEELEGIEGENMNSIDVDDSKLLVENESEYEEFEMESARGDGVGGEELQRQIRYEWRTKSCPVGCQCTINNLRAKKVECSDTNLIKRSQQPPADLTILAIRNTTIDLRKINLLRKYVMELKIADEEYPALNEDDLEGFENLQILKLVNSGLMEIAEDSFKDLKSLRQLDLGHNELKRIPTEIFEKLSNLTSFSLENNPLITLERDQFSTFGKLKTLNLMKTSLDDFPPLQTENNVLLEHLWLDGNELVDVPDFNHLPALKSVSLSSNPIEYIKTKAFFNLTELVKVYMSDLEFLIMIEERAFSNLPKLNELQISGCRKLQFIHAGAFEDTPMLRVLDLSGNGLHTVTDLWNTLPRLELIKLEHNSLECDCSISWMTEANLNDKTYCKMEKTSILVQNYNGTSWECSSALFMPTQYTNQTIIEYEGQEVRIGCFSSDSSQKINIKTPKNQPDVNGDFLSISNVSPFDSGKYKCQTENGSVKTIFLKVIGNDGIFYEGQLEENNENEEESSFTILKYSLILLSTCLLL